SAQIREILISESAWEEMTCLFAPSLSETLRINDNMLNHWYHSQNRMLSPTERAILRYMSCGYSIPEIAAELERNIKTIRAHKFNAMVKLGVNSDVGLLDAADILTHLPARDPQSLALSKATFL
ncbi:LuxR C-terminal-related transcriptional regulator, partial [Enterobacter sichuanensis]